ncbi:hypothetical protein QRD02_10110 [Aequorivita sp. SDUM287046]|uniref:DUF4890 domain-containing protein n=1 Tax=Aequorivita aurantiaca TaxID=3053356 RepID=A0ABT8DIB1_9FLAO|nr:hypothetical protein [Aequorivita aurantiaca]MDN3724738.1 hypothetical protein [Aequorivita aurantiaca]
MKKVVIILMALATFAMSAQNKPAGKKENRTEAKPNYTPEQKADLKSKQMTLVLDLTPTQQQQVKQIILKSENEKPQRPTNWKEMTDTQKYEAKSAMLDRRIAMKKEMKQILTEEQLTKWEQARSKKHGKHKARQHQGKK